jgi:hypothetical protein
VATFDTLCRAFDLAAVFAGILCGRCFHWLAVCCRGGGDCFWDSMFGFVSIAPYSILLLPHINSQINKIINLRISVFFCERFTAGEGPQDGV